MRIFATLAVLAAIVGGAAALASAHAGNCQTYCNRYGNSTNCQTYCF